MNLYSFSLLRHWLITYHNVTDGNNSTDADDRSEVDGSLVSMVSATSSSSRLLPPKERLREKSFQYCQRLIEQSDRKALKRTDTELQKACLVEAVRILDGVCVEDAGCVYRAFPCVKSLFGRLNSDLSCSRVLLPIAQFYLNHGETAAVDSECVWRCVFGVLPAECFNDPYLAHETLSFIRANQLQLHSSVPLYTHYFPSLLKLGLQLSCCTLYWTCPVSLLLSPCSSGLHASLCLSQGGVVCHRWKLSEAPPIEASSCSC
ncbi:AP-5 complex subunit zeta-1-like [Oncorhynchus nerka]|uniref:AP-5 complex subunit zeta-1-like n=1 Tax=Oncorhynchus nerka TaxID=8023 RepID=UPI0031B80D5F